MPHDVPSWLPALVLMTLLTGCSPSGILNSLIPKSGFDVVSDVAYGPHPRQRLDIYIPVVRERPAPVVVFFYGGSWQDGAKDRYPFVGEAFTSAGAIVVVPDYRIWPEVMFPTFVEDAAGATAWVQANITAHGGDQERISLIGHSAGAHIAAMVALDHDFLEAAGGSPARLDGLVGLAGPYDFLPIQDPTIRKIFAVEDQAHTQPVNVIDRGAPRTLLIHGADDRTVRVQNSENLAAALEEAEVPARLIVYPGVGHIEIVAALARPLRWLARTRKDVIRFLSLQPEP